MLSHEKQLLSQGLFLFGCSEIIRRSRPRVSRLQVLALGGMAACWSLASWAQSAPPAIQLSASSIAVAIGKTTRLSWEVNGADRCEASGAWSGVYSGSSAARGSATSAALVERENVFVLVCSGPGGVVRTSVTVSAVPKPLVTLEASPRVVTPGGSVNLSWRTDDAESCSGGGAPFSGTKAVSGSETLRELTKGKKKFSLTCKGIGGSSKSIAEVDVIPPPSLSFSARASQVAENEETDLKWRAKDAKTCVASGGWVAPGPGPRDTSGTQSTGPLSESTSYQLICEGDNGKAEGSVTVEVVPAPEISLSLSLPVIAPGESVEIRWASRFAQSCKGTGTPFAGEKALSGVQALEGLGRGTKKFKLTCKGGGGTVSEEKQVVVIPRPTLDFSARASEVGVGTETTLKWRAKDAERCLANGAWSGGRGTSGSVLTGPLTQSENVFELTCEGLNGVVTETLRIRAVPPPEVTLAVTPSLVEPGSAAAVSWQTRDAQTCSASGGGWTGPRSTSGSESVQFTTAGRRIFKLTCKGVGGETVVERDLAVFPRPRILSFTVDATQVRVGQGVTLRWSTSDAKLCVASGAWSGPKDPRSDGFPISALPSRTNSFVLTCVGDGGEDVRALTVEVSGLPSINFRVSPAVTKPGASAELIWSSQGAERCAASGDWLGPRALSGTEPVTFFAPRSATFVMRCESSEGASEVSARLDVVAPALSFSAASLVFPATFVGSETTNSVITVRNTSQVEVRLNGISLAGVDQAQFSLATDCQSRLAAGASCSINIRFAPKSAGRKFAELRITSDANLQAQLRDTVISLDGTANAPSVEFSVVVPSFMQIDSDINDPQALKRSNNTASSAQFLTWPFSVGGFVALPGAAIPGAVSSTGDLKDIYRVRLSAGQSVVLEIDQGLGNEDLDLYLLTLDETLVDSSVEPKTEAREVVSAPNDGDYLVRVEAYSGAAKYLLISDSTTTAKTTGGSSLSKEFQLNHALTSLTEKAKQQLKASSSEAEQRLEGGESTGPLWVFDESPEGSSTTSFLRPRSVTQAQVVGEDTSSVFSLVIRSSGGNPDSIRFRDAQQRQKFETLWAIKVLGQQESFKFVEPNFVISAQAVPDDPDYVRQRWHYDLIQLPGAWDAFIGSDEVVVAVIDSGVSRHPDLTDNLLSGFDFVSEDPFGDGNGRDSDPSDPGIVRQGTSLRSSHGTHVAGTIAARGGNKIGGSGVAWRTKILPVRALGGTGSGSLLDILAAMRYAAGLGPTQPPRKAAIINLSLGSDTQECPQAYQQVIDEVRAAGVVVVAAAGNSSLNFVGSPANCRGVIAVSALGPQKLLSSYSNYGSLIDVAAPGGDFSSSVYSTDIRRENDGPIVFNYSTKSGTSMATPHVAGVLALMKGLNPALTPENFDALLASGAITDDIGVAGFDEFYGRGIVNSIRAVTAAKSPPPVTQPLDVVLSPGRMDFGSIVDQISVTVTVTGDLTGLSRFDLFGPTSWLSLVSVARLDLRNLLYTFAVKRDALPTGVITSSVVFEAVVTSGNKRFSVPVSVTKNPTSYFGNGGSQYALLWDPIRRLNVGQVSLSATGPSARARILADEPGDYWLIVGADLDNDFFICGLGEPCAAYPLTSGLWQTLPVRGALTGYRVESTFARRLDAAGAASVMLQQPGGRGSLRGIPRSRGAELTASSTGVVTIAEPDPGQLQDLSALPETDSIMPSSSIAPMTSPVLIEPALSPPPEMSEPASSASPESDSVSSRPPPVPLVLSEQSRSAPTPIFESVFESESSVGERSVPPQLGAISRDEDSTTAMTYLIERRVGDTGRGVQQWTLEHRSNLGDLFSSRSLPETAEVVWRSNGVSRSLPTTAWVRACSDGVWTLQDGYPLLAQKYTLILEPLLSRDLLVRSRPTVTLIESMACQPTGGIRMSGFALEIGSMDPRFGDGPTPAERFMLSIDSVGTVRDLQLTTEALDLSVFCLASRREHGAFCSSLGRSNDP